ncbi:MAG: DUF2115 domain-containing protein [Methanoculleus sp.]
MLHYRRNKPSGVQISPITMLMESEPSPQGEGEAGAIVQMARRMAIAGTKGELGLIIAREVGRYSLMDLQTLGGRLYAEMIRLPEPYRSKVHPYITEQLFGAHHQLLAMHRAGRFLSMTEPITDHETFLKFCNMVSDGCFRYDETTERIPFRFTPRHRAFYYLISAFTMFVLDQPGHPVGMPFPGGFQVEERNGSFYCLIRDREKEVPYSICNFCPALQTEDG